MVVWPLALQLNVGFAQVNKPVNQSNHYRATDDVADGDRQQVAYKEPVSGKVGKIGRGFLDGLEK